MTDLGPFRVGQILSGPLFSEPMRVETVRASGPAKGLGAATGRILLTPNERRVAEDRRDRYWLYVVTNCDTSSELQEPIKDPGSFPWHEVRKVEHYWLELDAFTKPMKVREPEPPPYGGTSRQ